MKPKVRSLHSKGTPVGVGGGGGWPSRVGIMARHMRRDKGGRMYMPGVIYRVWWDLSHQNKTSI